MKKIPELIEIGNNIRIRRKELRISQEDLALKSGIDRSYIGRIERGEQSYSILKLLKIARVLKTNPAIFFQNIEFDKL